MQVDDRGYLCLHRKALDSKVFSDEWLWRLWCWCLMKASYTAQWKDGRQLLPGQFATGRNAAADQLNVSPSKVYRGLHTLQEWGQIRLEVNTHFTVVTVCNWTVYQPPLEDSRTASEQRMNNGWTASEQPADTLLIKKESKDNTPPSPPRGATVPLPDIPPELNTPEFAAAWAEWIQFRRERKPKVTPTGAKRSLAALAKWGPARAIAAIHHSIANGWQGIFEPTDRRGRPLEPPSRTPVESPTERTARIARERDEARASADPQAIREGLARLRGVPSANGQQEEEGRRP